MSRQARKCVNQNAFCLFTLFQHPHPHPRWPVCQACYLCYTKKVFLARVLSQVVKASLMVSVWARQSLHLEQALFLEVRHGNAAASNPTASGSCYRGKGEASATSRIFHSVFHEKQQNLLREMKKCSICKSVC